MEFYGTVGVPLLYLSNLWLVKESGGLALSDAIKVIGLVVGLVGIAMWILSYLSLAGSFGVLPRKQKKVKKGVYRYFRHPMYLGIMFTFLGLSVANESLRGFVFSLVVMLPILMLRAHFEEKKLID